MIDKYQLTKSNQPEAKKRVLLAYDYVLHSELHSHKHPYDKGISKYAYRRWDMYVLLSCTRLSLVLGIAMGALFRIVNEYYLFKMSFLEHLKQDYMFFLNTPEFWVLTDALIIALLVLFFVSRGRTWILSEYEGIHEIAIKKSEITLEQLKMIFSSEYFEETEKGKPTNIV